MSQFKYLNAAFLEAMNEIGEYGHAKYGENSFHHMAGTGDRSRPLARHESKEIGKHAHEHFEMYLRGELHDKFLTRKHQLAAVAFNALMEFHLAGLESEDSGVASV